MRRVPVRFLEIEFAERWPALCGHLPAMHVAPPREAQAGMSVLFIVPQGPRDEVIRTAANIAYSSGIDWAAVTNFGTIKLVHARWPDDPTYITLRWTDYVRRLDELELLSPQSIVDGRLARNAQAAQRGRQVLQPYSHGCCAPLIVATVGRMVVS